MAFENDIVAGTKLVRSAIQSPNYIAGSTGWTINRDGSAEFANVTVRGPVIITASGLVVATIGANGNISGQLGSFNDVTFLDDSGVPTSLSGLVGGSMGRGLVGFKGFVGALPAPGNGVFSNIAWFQAPCRGDRLYLVTCTNISYLSTNFSDRWVESQWSTYDTINPVPGIFANTREMVGGTVGGISYGAPVVSSFLFASGGGAQQLATRTFVFQAKGQDATLSMYNPGGWNLMCFDVGEFTGNFPAMQNGGTGAPAGQTQRTTVYVCTASQSYDGSTNPIPGVDGTNNCYMGNFSPTRTYGNERSIAIFPGATIRSDLTGATVQTAKLWFYCFAAEESAGTLSYSSSTAAAAPGTLNPGSGTYGYDDVWPVPGWNSVSMLDGGGSSMVNAIIAGANSVQLCPTLFGLAATGFRGFGYDATLRPYMEITYTKP
jgi:hypothetical protein